MPKRMKKEYITKELFILETRAIQNKFDSIDKRFASLTEIVLDNRERIGRIEEKMATKDDVALILDRIDAFTKRVDVYDKKAIVQDYRLNRLENKVFGSGAHPSGQI